MNITYKEALDGPSQIIKLAKKTNNHIEGDLVYPIKFPNTTQTHVLSKQKQQHLTEMMSQMPEEEREFYKHLLALSTKNMSENKIIPSISTIKTPHWCKVKIQKKFEDIETVCHQKDWKE